MTDGTKHILSVRALCGNEVETQLARQPTLKHAERQEPLIKKSGVYFVEAQIVHEVMGAVEAVMQDKSEDNSCARAEGSHMSCVRAEALQNSQNSCARAEALQKFQSSCVGLEKRSSPKRNDAVVRPGVEDPVEDGRIPAEAGAGMIAAPCEHSEIVKMKHELTHIPVQPWRTSCVKGKSAG